VISTFAGCSLKGTQVAGKILLLVALLSLAVSPLKADSVLLTGDADWAPLSSPQEPQQGLINAIAVKAFEKAGIEAEVELLPWSRALKAGEAAEYHGITGAFYTEERAKVFTYSEPLFEQLIVLLARKDFALDRYEALDELKPYAIGKIQDNALAGGIEQAGLTFDLTSTVQSNVRKLVTNRVDLIAGVRWRLRHQIQEIGQSWDDFKVLQPPLGSQASYLAVSKQHPRVEWVISGFNKGMGMMRSDGTYDGLLNEFGLGPDDSAPSN